MVKAETKLRIMTFNLLASPDIFSRANEIIKTVKTYLPDVAGFQEATAAHYLTAIRKLTKNCGYGKANRIKNYGGGLINYTPILYREDKLTLSDSGGKVFDSRWKFTGTKSYNYAVFTENESGKSFAVINSHISLVRDKYNLRMQGYPADVDRNELENEWQTDNVRELKELCRSLTEKHGKIPTFLVGDFNFDRGCAAYGEMTGFCRDIETTAKNRTENINSYRKKVGNGIRKGMPIDHIFILKNTASAINHIIDTKASLFASDHSPVIADVMLN